MRNEETVVRYRERQKLLNYNGPYRRVEKIVDGPDGYFVVPYGATNRFQVMFSQLLEMTEQREKTDRPFKEIYEDVRKRGDRGWSATPGCGKCICEALMQDKRIIELWNSRAA